MAKKAKPKSPAVETGEVVSSKQKKDEPIRSSSPTNKSTTNPKNKKRGRAPSRVVEQPKKKEPRTGEAQWSKSKKKRMRHLKAKQQKESIKEEIEPKKKPQPSKKEEKVEVDDEPKNKGNSSQKKAPSSSLQKSFQERLSGSRFRTLNEELYTTTSQAAFKRFSQQPELLDEYHEGFRHQVEQWPVNPVDVLVQKLLQQKQQAQPLVVADFGCGDAALGKRLLAQNTTAAPRFTVHSLDLAARGPNAALITACDCAHTPLPSHSVDVGIFCLSLMGTNLADLVREAHRVLRPSGRLHIAEVRSRFEEGGGRRHNHKRKNDKPNDNTEDEDPLQKFVRVLEQLGFDCVATDRSNTMFVLLELQKNGQTPNPKLLFTAKPCLYKRR